MMDRNTSNPLSSLFSERRLVAFAVAVCLVLSAMAALFAVPAVEAVEEKIQIKVGCMSAPDTFNSFSMIAGLSYIVNWMMYEMLYNWGPELEPYPQLAESHSVSDDGTVWTYHLADDSYFHDGHQVTADDVAFTFNMIMDNPKDCALALQYLSGFVYPVVATDDYTVQITLEEPKATMLSIVVPILPEHLWSAVVEDDKINKVDLFDTKYFPDGPCGSGPLKLVEYDKTGSFLVMEKQDPYHRLAGIQVDSVNVDELLFVWYTNEGAMVTALETGEIDVVSGVPVMLWETLMKNPDIEGQIQASNVDITMGFNCASEAMRTSVDENGKPNFPKASTNYETCNLAVRQAIAMATNKTLLVEEVMQDLALEGDSMVPTATPFWHYYVPEEEKWPFDIEAANELLNESGYNQFDGSDFGFAGVRENETSGVKLEFDFYYIRAYTTDQLTVGKMALWCEQIGIKLVLDGMAEGTLYNAWFNMEYDMFMWDWWPDVDPTFILSVLTTDEIPENSNDITAWSDVFYSNPVYDQMYIDQQKAMDIYKRQDIVHEMQRIVYIDCPYLILWYPAGLIAYRTDNFMNFPDMERYTGKSPYEFWFYFEVLPYEEGANTVPYDVDAGDDVTVYVGEEQTFSGSAKDLESPQDELNWTWSIVEFDETTTLYEQTAQYTFDDVGTFVVTLSVADPEGLSASDSLTATVVEVPEELGWVVGRVQDNSTAETAGDPIEGVLVSVEGMVDGSLLSLYEYTDEQGLYNISVVPGTYVVNASAEGYSNGTASVTVEVNETIWQNFTLKLTSGSVAGQVLDSVTEEPVADALVQLYEPGEENASYAKKTDDNGSFEILLVDTGVYEAVVSKDGYETNDTEDVTVTAGEAASLDIYLTAAPEPVSTPTNTIVIAAIALLVVIAVAAVAIFAKRKKKKGPEVPDDEPSEPTEETPRH